MTSELTAHEVVLPGLEELRVEVSAPADWEISVVEDPPFFLAQMPQALAGPFADNLIVNIERLGDDAPADLEELQGLIYAQAFASVPDFYAVDDRPHEVDGRPGWFRASLQTAPPGPSAYTRIANAGRLGTAAPADLEELQGLIYAQAFASVPDFYAVDDRPHEVDGRPGWFRASLQTAPPGITAMNRQVFTLRGDLLVTLSLTTMAFRDPEASELFDAVVASCGILSEKESD